jgi:hypothetical protein
VSVMNDLSGTAWTRRSDDVLFRVVDDSDRSGAGNRSIRMRNIASGREHWATPEGLSRKYTAYTESPDE